MYSYTWQNLIDDVTPIIKSHIGTCNQEMYGEIKDEIQQFITSLVDNGKCSKEDAAALVSVNGSILYLHSPYNSSYVLNYTIEMKKNVKTGNPTGTVTNITLENCMPDLCNELTIMDLCKYLKYEYAKSNREKLMEDINEYENRIADCEGSITTFENDMKRNALNEKQLNEDLKRYT